MQLVQKQAEDKLIKSAYIHIPFCLSKCKYCSFVSYTDINLKTGYLYSLLKEITDCYEGDTLETLYFGGGTPSLYTAEELEKILKKFNITGHTEITIEVNPDSAMNLEKLREIGFNRLSIGVQTFDNTILKEIGRRHNSEQAIQTVENAKKAGFDNISIDLIYGLPNQTLSVFKNDLNVAKSLPIQHVSLYGLKIDEGCYYYNHFPKKLPDDDVQADMYLLAAEELKDFEHYEISNWGKIQSKHNLNYWQEGEYYGFGAAAHGFVDGVRYSNYRTLNEYMDNPTKHEYGKFLTEQEKLEESIFLGLRIAQGIDVKNINNKFGIDFDKKYKKIIDKYTQTGHFIKTENGYRFSLEGFLLSNIILSEFLN